MWLCSSSGSTHEKVHRARGSLHNLYWPSTPPALPPSPTRREEGGAYALASPISLLPRHPPSLPPIFSADLREPGRAAICPRPSLPIRELERPQETRDARVEQRRLVPGPAEQVELEERA